MDTRIEVIETLLRKSYDQWTECERNEYGDHNHLRKEKSQFREEKNQLKKILFNSNKRH